MWVGQIWLGASAFLVQAQSDATPSKRFAEDGPSAGFQIAQAAERSTDGANPERLASTLKDAAEAYERAAFSVAIDHYDNARALAPDRADIEKLLQSAKEKLTLQREALKSVPKDDAKRQEYFKASYAKAKRAYDKGDFQTAYDGFFSLWLVAGKYNDTVSLMAKSKSKLGGEPAAETIAKAAPPAAAASKELSAETKRQIDGMLAQAQLETQAGRPEEARKLYQEALALDPENKTVKRQLSQLPEAPASAPKTAAKAVAVETAPAPAPAAMEAKATDTEKKALAAEAERLSTTTNAATAEAEKANRTKQVASLLSGAREDVKASNFDAAEKKYQDVLSLESGNKDAIKGIEKVKDAQGKANEQNRKATLTQLLDTADKTVASNPTQAKQQYESALSLDPKNKRAEKGLKQVETALAQERETQIRQAIDADLQSAKDLSAKGDYTQAHATLDNILRQAPDYKPAREEMKRLVALESAAQTKVAPVVVPPPVIQSATKATVAEEPAPATKKTVAAATVAPPAVKEMPAEAPPALHPIDAQPAEIKPVEVESSAKTEDAALEAPQKTTDEIRDELDRIYREALENYKKGNIEEARKLWIQMLHIKPDDKRAATYLEQTKGDYQRVQADQKAQEQATSRSKAAQDLLNSPVTISTDRLTPLAEFMRIISFSTPTEIQYYIASGAEADVMVNFVDKPLRDVLDTVLTPRGLAWSIDEKNVITIKPEFIAKTYQLSPDQLNRVRGLIESGDLQRIVWGQQEPPAKGVEMTIDERQRVLLVVGSKLHIQKLDELVLTADSGTVAGSAPITQIYKIRPEDGPKIKSLINALINQDPSSSPLGGERKIYIDGPDLIIHDTADSIKKIEELLLDENFIQSLRNEQLDIANFSLVPRDVENQNSDQISVFTNRVVEAVETLLYARTGKKAAQGEGRRLWFDQGTLQLTVVDTPSNLGNVGRYIESLPELRQRKLQKVIKLVNAVAEDLASELQQVLGLTEGGVSTGGKGDQVVKVLRRGDQFTFHDLRVRLIRVEEGDPNDRNDDEAELQLNTGTQTSNITIRELDTTYFENYEITAEDVQPAGGSGPSATTNSSTRGEGRARVVIRYVEPIEGAPAGARRGTLTQQATGGTGTTNSAGLNAPEDVGLTINAFGPLNSLILRYDNPSRLEEAEDLIKQLDKPTKQVEVETKFVQVNETRAREFSADFNLDGLRNGEGLDKVFSGKWALNSRFAQFKDEFRDQADPPIESPLAANLIKGTTILDLVLGGGSVPALNFQLRLLEAEGVINITNGPKVTMMDAIRGEFRIEKLGPGSNNAGQNQNRISPYTSQSTNETLREEDGSRFQNRLTSVILEVTPEITSEQSIIFEIIAELLDFDDNLGQNLRFNITGGNTTTGVQLPSQIDPNPGQSLLAPAGFNGTGPVFSNILLTDGLLFRTRKLIDTTARTHDGGTIVLGGWTGERAEDMTSGIPVLRNMPYFGKLLFSRNQRSVNRVTLLIFLSANLVD